MLVIICNWVCLNTLQKIMHFTLCSFAKVYYCLIGSSDKMAAFKRLIKLGKGAKNQRAHLRNLNRHFQEGGYLFEMGNLLAFIRLSRIQPFGDRFLSSNHKTQIARPFVNFSQKRRAKSLKKRRTIFLSDDR